MRKIVLNILLLFCLGLPISAQVDLTGIYSNNANLSNANLFPSHLGDDMATVQVDLINLYGYAGVTTFNRAQVEDLLNATQITNADIDNVLSDLNENTNQFLTGMRFQPLNVGIRINKKIAFGFGAQERPEFRFALDGRFLELLWQGNGDYGGQTVDLGQMALNFNYVREFYVAGAYSIINEDNLKVRVGSRLKVLQSLASIYSPDNNISLYTEPNGRYLDFNYDYRVNTGFPFDPNAESLNIDPFSASGSGFGIDLGGNVQVGKWHASLGLTDLGAARYSNNVYNYFQQDTFRFEGVEIGNAIDGIQIDDSAFVAQLTDFSETQEAYTVPLPARIALQGAYRIKKKTAGDHEYYAGSVFVTLVQGINPNSTFGTNTLLSVGGAYDLFSFVNVGANVSTMNFDNLRVGGFLSFRLFVVRLGIGTSNFLPLVSRNSGLSTDVHFNLGINF